ncbi:hypothetical protein KUF71_001605 [Frankliniella fusca]|uniref:Uncharacterized protein n=1 Tax=Frankliniella fusca TaxID=407009 RepID=A0AAE1HKC8_9NEOP|nr:hypothetical protein KUF71_020032 [Frankliniella fusca]KAK3922946.1 hypothetical protein KUF71_001605 [Frankliniella fusca]
MASKVCDEGANSVDIAKIMWGVDQPQIIPSYSDLLSSLGIQHEEEEAQEQRTPIVSDQCEAVAVKRGRPRKMPETKSKTSRVKKTRQCKASVNLNPIIKGNNEKKRLSLLFKSMADICVKMSEICKEASKIQI